MSLRAQAGSVAQMSQPESSAAEHQTRPADQPAAGVWCIVVAGGSGARYGGMKQFEKLAGERIIDRSVRTAAGSCEGVVVVLPADFQEREQSHFAGIGSGVVVVAGGSTRAESVRAGIASVPEDARFVLVHDGARPLATPDVFRRVIDALAHGAEAVVPAVAVADTLRSVHGGTVDRDSVRAVQTPQGFSASVLRAAHAGLGEATDDAGLVELLGHRIALVDGERLNLKVTEPLDLAVAEAMLTAVGQDSCSDDD